MTMTKGLQNKKITAYAFDISSYFFYCSRGDCTSDSRTGLLIKFDVFEQISDVGGSAAFIFVGVGSFIAASSSVLSCQQFFLISVLFIKALSGLRPYAPQNVCGRPLKDGFHRKTEESPTLPHRQNRRRTKERIFSARLAEHP